MLVKFSIKQQIAQIYFLFKNFFKKKDKITIIKNPIIGKYISGEIIKDEKLGMVLFVSITLLKPLPRLTKINAEGKMPIKVPR